MKISQYTHDYLNTNAERGPGKGLTIQSYLRYHLRGAAKSWSSRYARSLTRSVKLMGAQEGRSYGSSTAYYPA